MHRHESRQCPSRGLCRVMDGNVDGRWVCARGARRGGPRSRPGVRGELFPSWTGVPFESGGSGDGKAFLLEVECHVS